MLEPEQIARYRRELRAMCKAATHDPEAFAVVAALIDGASRDLTGAAHVLIADGFSWRDIGRALNMTRQGAHRKYATARIPAQ